MAFTLILALSGGAVSGFVLRSLGSKKAVYEDGDEFAPD
jgi:hypothetical protein